MGGMALPRYDDAMRAIARVVAASLGIVLSAQQALPEPAAIATALAGDAAHDVAWAAHHARERADKQLVKPLLHALGRWRLSNDENAGFVCVHLLDALVELDARVPAGDLVPLVDDERCGTWAFVLLAREPRLDEAELFTIFRRDWPAFDRGLQRQQDLRTLAIGNLLAAQGPPGFARQLLGGLDLDLHVAVVDAVTDVRVGGEVKREVVGLAPRRRARADHPQPEDWPALPALWLEPPTSRSDEASVRVPEAMRIRAVRTTKWRDVEPDALAPGHVEPPLELRWLATVANLAIPSAPRRTPLDDADAFAAMVVRAREQQQVFVDVLRRELIARRALTEKEAEPLRHRVVALIIDERGNREVPLPTIPPAR